MRDPDLDNPYLGPESLPKTSEPGPGFTPAAAHPILTGLSGRRRGVLVVAAAFQVAVLLGMVVVDSRPLRAEGRRTVLLRVVPVDPRDLLRGDYVTLAYDINRADPGFNKPDPDGRPVYVSLAPEADGRHYHKVAMSYDPPGSGLFLRGTLGAYGRVTYGIESYFVQEGKGRAYEDAARNRRLSAEVAVSPDGQPALLGLVIE